MKKRGEQESLLEVEVHELGIREIVEDKERINFDRGKNELEIE